jgi:hypothetical protein
MYEGLIREKPRQSVPNKTDIDFNSLHNPSSVLTTTGPLHVFGERGEFNPRKFGMSKPALILEKVLAHEKNRPDFVYMTQPIGNGQVIDYTWRETLKQARSMAAYIKAQNLEPGARVAILSKNCAHFIMAELAIWMSGCTTVAIFPTELGATVR